jgi:hypothetical protein
MSLRDLIAELRSGTPETGKVSRWLRYAGYACFLTAAWNGAFLYVDPEGLSELPLPPYFEAALVTLVAAGCLMIIAGRGVSEKSPGAVLWGQLAILLIVVLLAALTYWMMWLPGRIVPGRPTGPDTWPEMIWTAACVLVSLQFFVPAYYAFGYLQRMKKALEDGMVGDWTAPSMPVHPVEDEKDLYCHALLPFGVHITFIVVLCAGLFLFLLLRHLADGTGMHLVFLPIFLIIFGGPILYNYIPSPFQKKRQAVEIATGGGSIFLLNGSWPFFRLLIYADGIEIRFFLHAWFIPYPRLESVTLKRNFLSKALLICSDLPKVPSRIRFFSLRKKDLLARIEACRQRHDQGLA